MFEHAWKSLFIPQEPAASCSYELNSIIDDRWIWVLYLFGYIYWMSVPSYLNHTINPVYLLLQTVGGQGANSVEELWAAQEQIYE